MRIIVTRPQPDAQAFAALLQERGVASLVEPMLAVRHTAAGAPEIDGVQALLLTSANGARALLAACGGALPPAMAALPVFAVGAATAAAARATGFDRVRAAGGDVAALAAEVAAALSPRDGALLQVRARDVAGDLAGALAAAGFDLRIAVLYRTEPRAALSPELQAALRDGRVDGAALFSARTARAFARLLGAAGLAGTAAGLDAFCLSQAVADAAAGLPWRSIRIAAAPNAAALADLVVAAADRGDRLQGVE